MSVSRESLLEEIANYSKEIDRRNVSRKPWAEPGKPKRWRVNEPLLVLALNEMGNIRAKERAGTPINISEYILVAACYKACLEVDANDNNIPRMLPPGFKQILDELLADLNQRDNEGKFETNEEHQEAVNFALSSFGGLLKSYNSEQPKTEGV